MPPPTADEIARVERHLRHFSDPLEPPEQAMLNRLKAVSATVFDQRFFEHETLEAHLMESGIEWVEVHLRVLQMQGINYQPGYEAHLYHPDVIFDREMRLWFSQAARELSGRLAGAEDD